MERINQKSDQCKQFASPSQGRYIPQWISALRLHISEPLGKFVHDKEGCELIYNKTERSEEEYQRERERERERRERFNLSSCNTFTLALI